MKMTEVTLFLLRKLNVNIIRKLQNIFKFPSETSVPVCCLFQKMDRNNDGVVTIEEFLETCQKVPYIRGFISNPPF